MQECWGVAAQRPSSSRGGGAVTATPLPPSEAAIELAAPVDRQQNAIAAKTVYVVARPERLAPWRAASLAGGDNSPLFLRPTELADGLALKELRYKREVRFSRPLARFAPVAALRLAAHLVPPFPGERLTRPPGDSAGLFEGREFNGVRGRVNKCRFVTRSAAILANQELRARSPDPFLIGCASFEPESFSGYDSTPCSRGAAPRLPVYGP
jgi:hypothetical protein